MSDLVYEVNDVRSWSVVLRILYDKLALHPCYLLVVHRIMVIFVCAYGLSQPTLYKTGMELSRVPTAVLCYLVFKLISHIN